MEAPSRGGGEPFLSQRTPRPHRGSRRRRPRPAGRGGRGCRRRLWRACRRARPIGRPATCCHPCWAASVPTTSPRHSTQPSHSHTCDSPHGPPKPGARHHRASACPAGLQAARPPAPTPCYCPPPASPPVPHHHHHHTHTHTHTHMCTHTSVAAHARSTSPRGRRRDSHHQGRRCGGAAQCCTDDRAARGRGCPPVTTPAWPWPHASLAQLTPLEPVDQPEGSRHRQGHATGAPPPPPPPPPSRARANVATLACPPALGTGAPLRARACAVLCVRACACVYLLLK